MPFQKPFRIAVAAIAIATLAACGGGSADPQLAGAQEFASRSAAAQDLKPQRLRALAVSAAAAPSRPVTRAEVFAWAQVAFPDLFGTAPPQAFEFDHNGDILDVRAYTVGATVNYLGISKASGIAYGLGPYTGNAIQSFGNIQDYACLAVPSICQGTGGGGGQANQCIDPNASNPPVGFRTHLVYGLTGAVTGEQTVDTLVDGAFTFEGQTATQISLTMANVTSMTVQGMTMTTRSTINSKDYQLPGVTSPWRHLGGTTTSQSTTDPISVGGVTIPGQTVNSAFKTVYTPPSEAIEFTLAVGGSVAKTETVVTTMTAPVPSGPTTSTDTMTYTFEAVENVTVPAGTFSACRYRMTMDGASTTSWLIVGKGVAAKSVSVTEAGTQTMELRPGSTYGGAPL